MIRSPADTFARTHASMRSGVPISSRLASARSGAPPCSGTGERADRTGDGRHHIGAGRRDHAGGERRRVEAVVDRRDQVVLDRARLCGARLSAGHQVQPVRRGGEVGSRLERLLSFAQAVQRRQDRRRHRARRASRRPCAVRGPRPTTAADSRAAASSDNAVRRPASGLNDGPAVAIAGSTARTSAGSTRSGASSATKRRAPRRSGAAPRTSGTRRPRRVFDLARSIAEYWR